MDDDEALESELEEVRVQVNELDDRRGEIEAELRETEERLDSMRPFADLGIDLDLLSGYDTIEVRVGEADEDDVRAALDAADGVDEFEVFAGDRTLGVFARADPEALDEALVGADFTALEVPDAEGSPESYMAELRTEVDSLESDLEDAERELERLEAETAGFLLAAEETLSIDVAKSEAPLQFATTEHAFIAEGWIPTNRYDELASTLQQRVGDRVSIEELERADYKERGGTHYPTEQEVATDGGYKGTDEPPVVQDNPGMAKPFELLVETINRPKYSEFDPTVILFLTFPVFFGFMIGDLGYGLLYAGIGYLIYSRSDSLALSSLGGIAVWSGVFTALFGILYGEIFGFHVLGEILFGGNPPMHKGLQPHYIDYAYTWMVLSLLIGLGHMTLGYVLGFIQDLEHSLKDAVLEKGSWVILFAGIWTWIFSRQATSSKPDFLFTVFDGEPFALGFGGFPASVGTLALGIALVGLVLMIAGEVAHLGAPGLLAGALESLKAVSEVISYTRIAAVLLAKAGMAFVVNLLAFGAYQHDGEFHFMTSHGPEWVISHYGSEAIMFSGLFHAGIAGILGGILILVIGHVVVLLLGITSAGLQAVRLEYVEFFGKFYDGGGEKYEPFGYDRAYTTED